MESRSVNRKNIRFGLLIDSSRSRDRLSTATIVRDATLPAVQPDGRRAGLGGARSAAAACGGARCAVRLARAPAVAAVSGGACLGRGRGGK